MYDYNKRYSDNWRSKASHAREKTDFHCCLCLKKTRYLECHHVVYCNRKKKAIAGKERVGVHVFPLCKKCHSKDEGMAHHPTNWIVDSNNPDRNRNTSSFYKKLCANYQQIQDFLKANKPKTTCKTKSKNIRKTKPKSVNI